MSTSDTKKGEVPSSEEFAGLVVPHTTAPSAVNDEVTKQAVAAGREASSVPGAVSMTQDSLEEFPVTAGSSALASSTKTKGDKKKKGRRGRAAASAGSRATVEEGDDSMPSDANKTEEFSVEEEEKVPVERDRLRLSTLVQHVDGPDPLDEREMEELEEEEPQHGSAEARTSTRTEHLPVAEMVADEDGNRPDSQAGEENSEGPCIIRRWKLLVAVLVVVAIALVVVVAVVASDGGGSSGDTSSANNDNPSSPPEATPPPVTTPTPAPNPQAPESGEFRAAYAAGWFVLCADPIPGILVSCGPGGIIDLTSTFAANCQVVAGRSDQLNCTAPFFINDLREAFYTCTGSTRSALTTEVEVVSEASLVCNTGETPGVILQIAKVCEGDLFDYDSVVCDPAGSESLDPFGQKACQSFTTCSSDTCSFATPLPAARILQDGVTAECLGQF